MTDIPKPSSQATPAASPGSEPVCTLLAMCVECGQGVELPLPIDQRALALLLAQIGWFISVMSPPGQGPEVPMILGPLCTSCAQQVYSPDVFKVAEEQRHQLLQAAAQAAQAAQGPR